MISITTGAMAEARAGYYPACAAMERLEAAFLDAVARHLVPASSQRPARGWCFT